MKNGDVRILVVDDEPQMADSVKQNLVEEGYSVDIATSGAAAIESFDQAGHQIVICDLEVLGVGLRQIPVTGRLRNIKIGGLIR